MGWVSSFLLPGLVQGPKKKLVIRPNAYAHAYPEPDGTAASAYAYLGTALACLLTCLLAASGSSGNDGDRVNHIDIMGLNDGR